MTDWDRFVKPHDILLTDDIRHFAWNGEPDSPLLGEPLLSRLRVSLQRLLDGKWDDEELDDIVQEDRRQKENFLRGVAEKQEATAAQVQELKDTGQVPSFGQYLESQEQNIARHLARRVGVERACQDRGMGSLLTVRSVKVTVGLALSFIYRTTFEGKKPKIGASRDLQHALPAATAADMLVTYDEELAFLLRRVPMVGFRVVTLHELLERGGKLKADSLRCPRKSKPYIKMSAASLCKDAESITALRKYCFPMLSESDLLPENY
jgi:hypothetical protein